MLVNKNWPIGQNTRSYSPFGVTAMPGKDALRLGDIFHFRFVLDHLNRSHAAQHTAGSNYIIDKSLVSAINYESGKKETS